MSYEDNIRQNRKQSAQERAAYELHRRLEDVELQGREAAERRWIWELLQNACDMVGQEKIRIRIDYKEGSLQFSHTGNVFNSKELSRLTEQNSSKRDEEGPSRSIGRFGTGFLTTHLLSRKVHVRGIVHDVGERPKEVDILLDRSGNTSEELRKGVENVFNRLEALDTAPDADYKTGDFNTSFSYELDEQGSRIAEIGIEDLQKCLPLTLAFNTQIESVELVNKDLVYKMAKSLSISDEISRVDILIGESLQQYLVIVNRNLLAIAIPIVVDSDQIFIKSLDSNLPRLFCAFPLIGSECVEIPVVINSAHFHPTESRSGVLLMDSPNSKPKENRQLILEAMQLFWLLTGYCSEQKCQNLFVLFDFGKVPNRDWISTSWFNEQVIMPAKKRLLRVPLIENKLGEIKAFYKPKSRNVCIPIAGSSENRMELWKYMSGFKPELLPRADQLEEWADRVWEKPQHLFPEDIVALISGQETLSQLCTVLKMGEQDTIAWLNSWVKCLNDLNESQMYTKPFTGVKHYYNKVQDYELSIKYELIDLPILPDQVGRFKHLRDLFIDKVAKEDEGLKDILESFGTHIRSELLDRRLVIDDDSHRVCTSQDLADKIEKIRRQLSGEGERNERAYRELLNWVDNNEERANGLFPNLAANWHELLTAEQAKAIRMEAAQAKELKNDLIDAREKLTALEAEVEKLRANQRSAQPDSVNNSNGEVESLKAEQIMKEWLAIKSALGELEEIEYKLALKDLGVWMRQCPGLFEHLVSSTKDAFILWMSKVYRAKAAVRAVIEANTNYNAEEWGDDERFPTIVTGVTYRSIPVTLVIRPADGGYIILYEEIEKEILTYPDAQLWIEGGEFSAQRWTIGKLALGLEVNKFPLRVPLKKNIDIQTSTN